MKTFSLNSSDTKDLLFVLQDIISGESKNLDFKKIIILQKTANDLSTFNTVYLDKYNAILQDRQVLLKIMQKKVQEARKDLTDKFTGGDKSKIDKAKEKVDALIGELTTEFTSQITEEFEPKVTALDNKEGQKILEIEISEDKHKALVEVFEEYAKDRYRNKEVMLKVYEAITNNN